MMEAEWRICGDPNWLLEGLPGARASVRKVRLLVCACCRAAWPIFQGTRKAQAVEVAEQQADGLMVREPPEFWQDLIEWHGEGLDLLMEIIDLAIDGLNGFHFEQDLAWNLPLIATAAAARALQDSPDVSQVRQVLSFLAATAPVSRKDNSCAHARMRQCDLIRDIFGPFRKVRIDPAVLAWNDGTIHKMAQIIYEERRFKDLPILADALEDAGCNHPDILSHCRRPGEHTRGCWLVDHLLDKE